MQLIGLKIMLLFGMAFFFLITCWQIWKSRNEEIFSDTRWQDWRVLSHIRSLLDSTLKAFGFGSVGKTSRVVSWHPLSSETVKLNTEGSSLGNPGNSGYGGLIRNSCGEWLLGLSGRCGFTSNLNAELHAISHGLDIAWDKGIKDVICELDSQLALSLVEKGVVQSHPYAPIVDYIRSFKNYNWRLSFVHTLQEGNNNMDWLAKFGANMDYGLRLWNLCPP